MVIHGSTWECMAKLEKENIAAITNEENRENDNVFRLENVQNYILAQRAENRI